jgi:hypothetical protein
MKKKCKETKKKKEKRKKKKEKKQPKLIFFYQLNILPTNFSAIYERPTPMATFKYGFCIRLSMFSAPKSTAEGDGVWYKISPSSPVGLHSMYISSRFPPEPGFTFGPDEL